MATFYDAIISENKNIFWFFFFHFRSLESILKIFLKNMTLIDDVFLILPTQKNVVR